MAFRFSAGAVCHKGKVRNNNEDNLFFDRKMLKQEHEGLKKYLEINEADTSVPALFAVFDGMGGHSYGERASYLSACVLGEHFTGSENHVEEFLLSACDEANDRICEEMERERTMIGTTASMLYFQDDTVWSCNIGDSPIFRLRDGELVPLFEEHTERTMREKIYGKEAVKGKKFPLTQHLGIFHDELEICPYTREETIKSGDQYLICSDGLTDMVSEEKIIMILQKNISVTEKAVYLRDLSLENGGRDNVTIIAIEIS